MATGVLPAVLGFLIVPTAGAALSAAGIGLAKPQKMSTKLLIGSAAHALVAYGSNKQAHNYGLSSGMRDFAQGGAWGSGISAVVCLGAAGFQMKDEGEPIATAARLPSSQKSSVVAWLSEMKLPQA